MIGVRSSLLVGGDMALGVEVCDGVILVKSFTINIFDIKPITYDYPNGRTNPSC